MYSGLHLCVAVRSSCTFRVPLLLFLNLGVLNLWTNRRHLAVSFRNLTHGGCSSLCFQHSQGSSAFTILLLPLLLQSDYYAALQIDVKVHILTIFDLFITMVDRKRQKVIHTHTHTHTHKYTLTNIAL